MAGVAEFWSGIDKMEAKIKWASIYGDTWMQIGSPFTTHRFQVMGSLESYTSNGRAAELPLVYLFTGAVRDSGSPVFKKHENVDVTSEISVYKSELLIAGVQVFMVDILANMYVVGGQDLLANFRANLGG